MSEPRAWCPGCEPQLDQVKEFVIEQRCAQHPLDTTGELDRIVDSEAFLSGSAEAGGEANRKWCEMLHRPKGDK
jgi:hypothetical protein